MAFPYCIWFIDCNIKTETVVLQDCTYNHNRVRGGSSCENDKGKYEYVLYNSGTSVIYKYL